MKKIGLLFRTFFLFFENTKTLIGVFAGVGGRESKLAVFQYAPVLLVCYIKRVVREILVNSGRPIVRAYFAKSAGIDYTGTLTRKDRSYGTAKSVVSVIFLARTAQVSETDYTGGIYW